MERLQEQRLSIFQIELVVRLGLGDVVGKVRPAAMDWEITILLSIIITYFWTQSKFHYLHIVLGCNFITDKQFGANIGPRHVLLTYQEPVIKSESSLIQINK